MAVTPAVLKSKKQPHVELLLAEASSEDAAGDLQLIEEVTLPLAEPPSSAARTASNQRTQLSLENADLEPETDQEALVQEATTSSSSEPLTVESTEAQSPAFDPQAIQALRAQIAAAVANEQGPTTTNPGKRPVGLGRTVDAIGRGRVKLFGVEGEGTRFAYVLDRSDSMAGTPLQAVKIQLAASLKSLEPVHQFHLIFFNHHLQEWRGNRPGGRHTFATEGNLREVLRFARSMTAQGGTYRLTALNRALAVRPDVLFFLTDADNPMPGYEVNRAIGQAANQATAIHTIEFGIGTGTKRDNFLKRLASETGGQYSYVNVNQLGSYIQNDQ